MEAERELDEESVGGLQGRRRPRGSADAVEHFFSSGALSVSPPSLSEEGGGGEAEHNSVYFDGDEVQSAVPVEISDTSSKNDHQNALWKKLATEKTDSDCKTSNNKKDISAEEAIHVKTTESENGLNFQNYAATHENVIAEIDDEITVLEETAVIKKSRSKVAEFDLEKVLEEQDTHDLYCPNCNSCITKRVILRKRKRLVTEIQNDVPAKKVHEEQCNTRKSASDAVSDEMTNLTDRSEPDIFRCLSCFSFFIPTDGGFNIFQKFKEGKDIQLQSSGQVLEKKANWITSFLNLDTTKKEESKQANLNEPYTVSEGVDESMQNEEQPTPEFKTGILKSEETHITSQSNDTDIIVNGSSSISLEEHTVGQAKPYASSTLIKSSSCDMVQTIDLADAAVFLTDVRIWNDAGQEPIQVASQINPTILGSEAVSTPPVLEQTDVRIDVAEPIVRDTEINNQLDVLKSIVYGGLIESLTSLGVVSSAAASGASTLNILALGLANLIGGFLVIIHHLYELRTAQDASAGQEQERSGRYWQVLGSRRNFRLHFTLAIASYIVFGLLPPVVYCFSFRISDNNEYKLLALAGASFLCIALLAIGKAHVKPQKAYIKTLLYYLSLAVSTSGISYVAGVMVKRLLESLGLFAHNNAALSPTLSIQGLSQRFRQVIDEGKIQSQDFVIYD